MSIRNEQRFADLLLLNPTAQEGMSATWRQWDEVREHYESYRDEFDRRGQRAEFEAAMAEAEEKYRHRGPIIARGVRDRALRGRLRVVPKIIADNVAEYAGTHDLGHPSDLPALAPPFEEFWVEARIQASGSKQTGWYGCYFVTSGNAAHGWTYNCYPFFVGPGHGTIGSLPQASFHVNPDGNVDTWDELWEREEQLGDVAEPPGVRFLIVVVLAAVSFLNCSNTQQVLVKRPLRDRKFGSTKGPKPLLTYRLLHVGQAGKVTKGERLLTREDEGTALHICRGHFRTYTEERPLFGRVVGTFWVPAHARGDARHGIAKRDYSVHPRA